MRRALPRLPAAAWMCALIALLNAFAWSLIVPPFEGKDEVDHFAYVAQIAEAGTLPSGSSTDDEYSPEESLVMEGIDYYGVRFVPHSPAIATAAEQRTLIADVNAGRSRIGTGTAGIATSEPPLYYALQTIPYALASPNMLAQLQLMRLVGALFAASTALFTFLFLREALPRVAWAATVGAPVRGAPAAARVHVRERQPGIDAVCGGGRHLLLPRARLRRGLCRRLALALGLLIAIGLLTKLNFVGLALGVYWSGGARAARRAHAGRPRDRTPALAAGVGLAPVALYALRNLLSGDPDVRHRLRASPGTCAARSGASSATCGSSTCRACPACPTTSRGWRRSRTSGSTARSASTAGWTRRSRAWVDNVALVAAAIVALLCARELDQRRHAIGARALRARHIRDDRARRAGDDRGELL